MMVVEKTALEELRDVCEERGIRVCQSDFVSDGDIVYKHRIKTVFVGGYIDERNVACFVKKLTDF